MHQLDLGYPGSSLALAMTGRSSGILAGDRAPDAPVRGAAGLATRLFALFQGPHWTLLGYQAERAIVAPRPHLHIHIVGPLGDIADDAGYLRDAYGIPPGDWMLVRPDGYVAAVIPTAAIWKLDCYLAEVGLVAVNRHRRPATHAS